jgi:hypothetical protein
MRLQIRKSFLKLLVVVIPHKGLWGSRSGKKVLFSSSWLGSELSFFPGCLKVNLVFRHCLALFRLRGIGFMYCECESAFVKIMFV